MFLMLSSQNLPKLTTVSHSNYPISIWGNILDELDFIVDFWLVYASMDGLINEKKLFER